MYRGERECARERERERGGGRRRDRKIDKQTYRQTDS